MPASTVVLVRPSEDGAFQIFMNRRPQEMASYAGVFVFPGGRVERTDWSSAMLNLVRGISPEDAQRKLGNIAGPEICLGYWVAAARELFEEAGIHFLCRDVTCRRSNRPILLNGWRKSVRISRTASSTCRH
jgi:8-oxo-dGTP pyrophosphatase MutT (NUDIX family)